MLIELLKKVSKRKSFAGNFVKVLELLEKKEPE